MRHLYFQHANGTFTLIHTDVETEERAWSYIAYDLTKRNPHYKAKKHESYRDVWNKIWFDVGSQEERYVIM